MRLSGGKYCLIVFMLLLAGCRGISSTSGAASLLPLASAGKVTVRLADVPTGTQLIIDVQPDNTSLANLIGVSDSELALTSLGRKGGSFRVFTNAPLVPGAYNGMTRASIEVDIFPSTTTARSWQVQRDPVLQHQTGARVALAAPGTRPYVYLHADHAGDIAATTSSITCTRANAYIEITTTVVGQGVSLAETERYVAIIIANIHAQYPALPADNGE